MNIDKWKKAVIHLECATDSLHYYDRIKKIEELNKLRSEDKISEEEWAKVITSRSRDIRYHGTAIFLKHNSKYYLITARHVVWDEALGKREFEMDLERVTKGISPSHPLLIKSNEDKFLNRVFSIIFRVPSLEEVSVKNNLPREFLMNLGAGAPASLPYTFSNPDIDLAIISLSQRDIKFAEELIQQGYLPIKIEDLGEEPTNEGEDVFAIGFPSSTALLGQMKIHPAQQNWSSSYFSLPICSFGKVSMLNEKLDFFWTDMSIYPGNSGGPVICNDKLVGIVIAQASIPIEGSKENLYSRIPFGQIVKAKYIKDLIKTQIEKDK